jgi:quercetin dioxygenase-like cupin family protein
MNRNNPRLAYLAAGWLAAFAAQLYAADEPAETKILTPEEIKWVDNPMRPGAKMAVIEGDPKQAGPVTMQFKFPADFKIPPHWHPVTERFVVLSGSLYEGVGEEADIAKAKLLKAGSAGVMPAKTPHYVFTKEEAVLQVFTTGPLQSFPVKQ